MNELLFEDLESKRYSNMLYICKLSYNMRMGAFCFVREPGLNFVAKAAMLQGLSRSKQRTRQDLDSEDYWNRV